jgi:hypothetical protein
MLDADEFVVGFRRCRVKARMSSEPEQGDDEGNKSYWVCFFSSERMDFSI